MADWTNLPNSAVGVGGLPSGTTVTALRDNPIAIAEGAAGAPRILGDALDKLFIGQISNLDVTRAAFDIVSLGECKGLVILGVGSTNASSTEVQIAFSTNNGASFGSLQRLFRGTSTSNQSFQVHLGLRTGLSFGIQATTRNPENLTLTLPSGTVNAVRFSISITTLHIYKMGGQV